MVEKSEDIRDILVNSLLRIDSRAHHTADKIAPRAGLSSGNRVAPVLSVWAILYVVVNSTRPCPTGALV